MSSRAEASSGAQAPVVSVAAETAGPDEAVDALAGSRDPYLIGVRHHSPAIASAIGAMLDAAAPRVLLIELPTEAAAWLPWLADPATRAPVALAGKQDSDLAFYPFADFSPELAAIRWAARAGVEVVPFDLPLADEGWSATGTGTRAGAPTLAEAMKAAASGRPDDDLWDRLVEARAPGNGAERIRRAALAIGWSFRHDAARAGAVEERDLRREQWMRDCLAAHAGRRVAVVAGSFHIPALTGAAATASQTQSAEKVREALASVTTSAMSLAPYAFPLLDERSGYPSGIRDPAWQQAVFEAGGDADAVEAALAAKTVAVCRHLRAAGHPAGPAEAAQVVRLAVDLARLRGLPAPARGELVESLQSVLAQGETLGRGRMVAAAMSAVLVGQGRGRVAPSAPRSGLRPAVVELLKELRLPGPDETAKDQRDLRLDPLRSPLDRRREITLRRLLTCGVGYAEPADVGTPDGAPALTRRWRASWSPTVEANLDLLTIHGVTLDQATEGRLRQVLRGQAEAGGPTPGETVAGLNAAAECGLPALADERLRAVAGELVPSASLPELLAAADTVDAIRFGHIAGIGPADLACAPDLPELSATLDTAAVGRLDGMRGSDDAGEARTIAALAMRAWRVGGELRLDAALRALEAEGSPLISGAAAGARALIGTLSGERLGRRAAGWLDAATDAESRTALRRRLVGLLTAAEPLVGSDPEILGALADRIESLPDQDFLSRLPALRGGFAAVSPAARDRLLAAVEQRIGQAVRDWGATQAGPEALLAATLADRAGQAALAAAGMVIADPGPAPARASQAADSVSPSTITAEPTVPTTTATPSTTPAEPPTTTPASTLSASTLSAPTRWRLLLGRDRQALPPSGLRYATALDELYGQDQGEGAAHGHDARPGAGAGNERPYPSVREWSEDLADLFGVSVREEVLGQAAAAGRLDAVAELDPAAVRPSVELLRQVLSLAGGLPESAVARLRPLVKRIVEQLAAELAHRLRPALTGLTSPLPTNRPSGALDLPRTIRANLATARRAPDATVTLLPERPVFHTRARRQSDWRIILVVDVSGSMESSVIWSALTASVFAALPALTTHFLAFSTEVVDLTDRAADPLSLLMEVRVGGGTHIATGLAAARPLVTVPTRTMVVLISDFEDGAPLGTLLAEVRALAEAGCTLLGCASLDDDGRPRYSTGTAGALVSAGMPVAALSPTELAAWVGEQVRSR
ncbi:VWA domain-containing protein [Catenulispora sp. NF23]|uniref:DUF5682 family protein n=1 Tax=Catenulispora pinistramenti TaxID=2705254 RepID=UPI001BAB79D7|nr:DUF5682 family protein [Catenulispora pinistramenti]MBS2534357.1 VWA domain-containing protein [Catenulispora pinistramenti]